MCDLSQSYNMFTNNIYTLSLNDDLNLFKYININRKKNKLSPSPGFNDLSSINKINIKKFKFFKIFQNVFLLFYIINSYKIELN